MSKPRKKKSKFRSSMEERIVPKLLAAGAEYEPLFLRYVADERRYIPDVVLPNGIAIEIKGWFQPSDRTKMLAVKRAYPLLDLRMVLAQPDRPLTKTGKTTQSQWCEKHGIKWAHNEVPALWLLERSLQTTESAYVLNIHGVKRKVAA